jgi:hypothetical protein
VAVDPSAKGSSDGPLAQRRLHGGCGQGLGQVPQAGVDGGHAVELRLAHGQGAGQVLQVDEDRARLVLVITAAGDQPPTTCSAHNSTAAMGISEMEMRRVGTLVIASVSVRSVCEPQR